MQETLAHVRCSLRRMDLKRPVLLRILVCIVAFFILFDLSFVGAWARDPSEAAFKITKALNIELFLNLLQTQGTAQPATTAYNLNPDNYRPQAPRDIKAAGFDAVRLAVEPVPLLKMNEAERHIIYRTFATYIDGYLAAGLNVIFDIHVTGRDPIWNLNTLATSTSDAKFKSYTETVVSVARFLGAYNPQHVALELFNEPPCISAARWSELQKTLYNVARAVVPNHTLVLTGPCWSSMDELQKIDVNEYDKNTIYTFHFYQPTLFTFQGIPWLEGGFKFLRRLPYPPTTNLSAAFISAIMADVKSAPGLDGSNKAKIINYLTREISAVFWNTDELRLARWTCFRYTELGKAEEDISAKDSSWRIWRGPRYRWIPWSSERRPHALVARCQDIIRGCGLSLGSLERLLRVRNPHGCDRPI